MLYQTLQDARSAIRIRPTRRSRPRMRVLRESALIRSRGVPADRIHGVAGGVR
jgi:hypothetical protein